MLERERKEDREPEGSPAMSGRIYGGSQGLLAERKTGRARARGTGSRRKTHTPVYRAGVEGMPGKLGDEDGRKLK